jgi:hypothetical protein
MNSEDPVGKNKRTPNAQRESDEKRDQSESKVSARSTSSESDPAHKHCEITCKIEKNWWDKAKPFAEGVGLIALVVYSVFTILMYRANKKSADAAEKAANANIKQISDFEAVQKAQLVVEFVHPEFYEQGTYLFAKGEISIRNVGQTVAHNALDQISMGAGIDFPNCKGAGKIEVVQPSRFDSALAPNQAFRRPYDFLLAAKSDIVSRKIFAFLLVDIAYIDAFGNKAYIFASYLYDPPLNTFYRIC